MFKVLLSLALVAFVVAGPFKRVPKVFHGGKIVGGVEAKIEDFPYQVSLRHFNEHKCGGSIIGARTILTAAHCTKVVAASDLSIMLGSANVEKGDIYQVESFTRHPEYRANDTDYDVSILKLSSSIVFSDKAAPVALQEDGVEVAVGAEGHVSGWGSMHGGEGDAPTILRTTEVDIVSHALCEKDYGIPITDRMLCAEHVNQGSCQGDSGGPLVVDGKQVGIVSWGRGCAIPYFPGVYSKVSNLRSWIEANR